MKSQDLFNEILLEIKNVLAKTDEKDFRKLVDVIAKSKRIFLAGSGRSGLIIETFAMRLAQMDLPVFIVGEANTPKIRTNDLLIVVSGSGKTKLTLDVVKNSKKAKVYTITSNKKSPIAKRSSYVVQIIAKTKSNKEKSIEPMGSLFEQSVLIYLDSVVLGLMQKMHKKESFLKKRHSKLR